MKARSHGEGHHLPVRVHRPRRHRRSGGRRDRGAHARGSPRARGEDRARATSSPWPRRRSRHGGAPPPTRRPDVPHPNADRGAARTVRGRRLAGGASRASPACASSTSAGATRARPCPTSSGPSTRAPTSPGPFVGLGARLHRRRRPRPLPGRRARGLRPPGGAPRRGRRRPRRDLRRLLRHLRRPRGLGVPLLRRRGARARRRLADLVRGGPPRHERAARAPATASFTPRPRPRLRLTLAELEEARARGATVIDARPRHLYLGEEGARRDRPHPRRALPPLPGAGRRRPPASWRRRPPSGASCAAPASTRSARRRRSSRPAAAACPPPSPCSPWSRWASTAPGSTTARSTSGAPTRHAPIAYGAAA